MTIVGDNRFKLGPVEYAWVAQKNGVYPYGITGTIANGSDAGMARALAFTELAENVPVGSQSNAVADNRNYGGFRQGPTEQPTSTLGFLIFDASIITALRGSTIYTDGEYDISWRSNRCLTLPDCALILNGRCKSEDSGAVNLPGWWTKIYPSVELTQTGLTHSGTSPDVAAIAFEVTLNEVDTTPWGQTIATNYAQAYGFVSDPIITDYPITLHTLVGDNTVVTYAVDETPAAADVNKFPLWIAGTKKTYTTDYAVVTATKTVTIEAAAKPAAGVVAINLYQFVPGC